MNYLAEINAFEKWLETNYLSPLSQLLWYKLIMLFNKGGWDEWITVENQDLMALIKAGSKNTFLRARDDLIEAGFLEYVKGKKRSPNRYKLSSVCSSKYEPQMKLEKITSSKFEPQTEPQTELKTEPQMEPQTEPSDQTKHKHKQNNITAAAMPAREDALFAFYGKSFDKLVTHEEADSLSHWRGILGEDIVIFAIEHVANSNNNIKSPKNYLDAVLKRWVSKGVRTMPQAKAAVGGRTKEAVNDAHSTDNKPGGFNGSQGFRRATPDCF